MITGENGTDPWTADNEPPVQALDEREQQHEHADELLAQAVAIGDKSLYVEKRLSMTLQDAERALIACEYDYRLAIEKTISASRAYVDAEAQQARTRVRVIEKLMSESEAAVGRKSNEAKRGEVLSISAAEKIVSGHPEYTAVRDQVAEALNAKTESERTCELLSHTLQNLREIVRSRRAGFLIIQPDGRVEIPYGKDTPLPRTIDLYPGERETIAARDSRGLDGIERKPMQEARREPAIERQGLGGRAPFATRLDDVELLDNSDQR